ncbi:MAG: RNA polymerase sigma factor [Actinomycetota bacterium]
MDGNVGRLEAVGSVRPSPDLIDFCEQQHPRLSKLLALYCGDMGLADDLAQEALARACRDWPKVRHLASPEAWIYRVAVNLAHSHFRRRAIEARVKRLLQPSPPAVIDEPSLEGAFLLQVIKRLPHRQRSALLLHYYFDLPVKEVAEILDCPEGTVKTLVHKASEAVRNSYDESEMEGNL